MTEQIRQWAVSLKNYWEKLEDAQEAEAHHYERMLETMPGKEWQEARDTVEVVRAKMKAVDDELRQLVVEHFIETGEKHILPGIGIREYTRVQYDEDEAREWCKVNLPDALKLDKRKFEKYVKAVSEMSPVPVAQVDKEPTATISSDLSEVENG